MTTLTETRALDTRLFEVERERTLAHRLGEIDYSLNHGQAAECPVCGGAMTGGVLGDPAECQSCGSTLE
jgi:hypothetical protein